MPAPSRDRREISEAVREYILGELLPGEDPAALTASTPLVTTGILDSIATLKLIAHLEDRFGVRFEANEIGVESFETVQLIEAAVARKLAG